MRKRIIYLGFLLACSQVLAAKAVRLGNDEVREGVLATVDGSELSPLDLVRLDLVLPEISRFVCDEHCLALYPRLFIRLSGSDGFREVRHIPQAEYVARGPAAFWRARTHSVWLSLPHYADRIELYMHFGRVSWDPVSCHVISHIPQCPKYFPISGEYLSNFGKNFQIPVHEKK